MVEFAHFTPSELPVTLAIFFAGIGIGLALAALVTRSGLGRLTRRPRNESPGARDPAG